VTWNFEKYLVGRDGRVVARFDPELEPEDPRITGRIEELLAASGGQGES
jgi:glutathione peroxidase